MKCPECNRDFPEHLIHESHNVPCYMFKGQYRSERKNQADKYGRKLLCVECHEKYEDYIRMKIIPIIIELSKEYFKEVDKNEAGNKR